MITYDLEQRGKHSKYDYLYRCIREDIRKGLLSSGTKLPSKRQLAEHLSISVSTVEQAYDMLVSEGYVRSQKGSGFYVAQTAKGVIAINPFAIATDEEDDWQNLRIDFKANKCSLNLFPKDTWLRVMRRSLSEGNLALFDTVPFNGLARLREVISRYLYEFKGIHASPDCIIVGAGTEYLYSRLLQLFGNRTVVAIGDPGYKKFADISKSMGILWEYLPVDDEGILVNTLAESPAEVVHVSPANHFPLGIEMSSDRRRALLDWVNKDPHRYIIEDDYDSELRFGGRTQPSLFTQDFNQKVIYLNTFSKTLVPSLRISYMVLPKALMELYSRQLSFYSCTVSSFEQDALARFIENGYFERHVNRLRRYYDKQRHSIVQALEKSSLMNIASISNPLVGTHLILSVDSQLSDGEILRKAQDLGMHLAMLSDYCINPTVRSFHYVVINFASIEPQQISVAVELLEKVFEHDIASVKASN